MSNEDLKFCCFYFAYLQVQKGICLFFLEKDPNVKLKKKFLFLVNDSGLSAPTTTTTKLYSYIYSFTNFCFCFCFKWKSATNCFMENFKFEANVSKKLLFFIVNFYTNLKKTRLERFRRILRFRFIIFNTLKFF